MPPVQGADPDREDQVEGCLAGFEDEVLGRDLPDAEPSVGDQPGRPGPDLGDGLEPGRDRPGRGAAADLQHPQVRRERQRVDDPLEPGREHIGRGRPAYAGTSGRRRSSRRVGTPVCVAAQQPGPTPTAGGRRVAIRH